MNIAETIHFDKDGQAESKGREWVKKFWLSLVICLVALLSFGIGRLTSIGGGEPIKIEYDEQMTNPPSPKATEGRSDTPGVVYASKNGKKYYYSGCSGLNRILEANKISFASALAAEASGYSLASGCSQR